MPVGFVSAAESKEELAKITEVPFITNIGRKGGSTVTVAALNAISILADSVKSMEKKVKKDPSSKLRHGYTTGACSTAVTKAALIALITGNALEECNDFLANRPRCSLSLLRKWNIGKCG